MGYEHHVSIKGLIFSETLKFLILCGLQFTKVICHSYQDYVQTSDCMSTVAMETTTNKVKNPFFIIFHMFLLFLKLQIKISIPQHTRGPAPTLCYKLGHIYS